MKLIDILRRHGKKINHGLIAIGVVIHFLGLPAPFTPATGKDALARETAHEIGIMGLYLYNFLLFVEWPEEPFKGNGYLHVNIFGDDALFDSLKPMIGKAVRGRKLSVTKILEEQDVEEPCHVLFIDSSKKALVPRLLKRVRNRSVLTISNIPEFTDMGGMVLFKDLSNSLSKEDRPKRFEVNLTAVEKAGLKIGSRLLRLSHIVREGVGK